MQGSTPTVADFLQYQAGDPFSRNATQNVGTMNAKHKIDRNRLTVQVVPSNGAVQIFVPQAFQERLLFHPNHPVMIGHIGQRQMYDCMQREFF